MNRKGQFSIIAALLVAAILITTVIVTYSAIRNSPMQNQPPILYAIDETNLAVKQILGFTVGYYGSILQVTGNVSYAKGLATNYLQSGLLNVANINPEWGISLNSTNSALQTSWFTSTSYSGGNLTVNYDLPGLGIRGINYTASCKLSVQTINSTNGQACLSITQDENEPLVTLGGKNFNFYRYNDVSSNWEFASPDIEPTAYPNGTYQVNPPSGVDPYSYVVQIEDQRGIIAVASSYNSYTCTLAWNSTLVPIGSPLSQNYVNNCNSNVDSSPDKGAHSNFPAQKNIDGVFDNLTESASNVVNAYYPTGFNLLGSTQNISGRLTDLASDNNTYMTFRSYQNAASAQTLYAHQETMTIGGLSYNLSKKTSADAIGTTLLVNANSTGRKLMGQFVYQLTGVSLIPQSTWTTYYRAYTTANAYSLDATGGYMKIGNGTPNWGSANGTISFWIKWSNTVANRPWGQHENMETRMSGSNLILDWGGTGSLTSTTNFVANKWYFIAIVWNENTHTLSLYVGNQTNAPTMDAQNAAWTTKVSTVGVTENDFMASKRGVDPLNGHGDELRYWSIDRNLASIQSDCKTELAGSELGLKSYFKLNNDFSDIGPNHSNGSGSGSYSFSSDVPFNTSSTVHGDMDILIRASNGTIRQTLASDVANSSNLAGSWSTLSGTYSWSNYTVVNQTDYLEIDYCLHVTSAGNGTAYLSIDNSTLAVADQTRATNIFLPSQYVSEVEFCGNSDLGSWASLTWTVDSSFTIDGLNATFQLFNNQTGTYPASGDGFIAATMGTANQTQTQIIMSTPTNFRNATGGWRLKVKANASTQFDWKVDLVKYQTLSVNCELDLEEQWTNIDYTYAQLCIKTGAFSGAEAIKVDAWNASAGAWINVVSNLNAVKWNNVTVPTFLQPSNFTIRFKGTNETSDSVQDRWQIDATILTVWPTADLYSLSRQGTIVAELLQNGTMRWLGQNLILTNSASPMPFPPIPVRSIHVNETINGVNSEIPFQIEDWSSAYRIPLGLTSNMSIFSSRTMLVFLATPNASKVTIWWNGSDTASQTPYAYTNRYFKDLPSSGVLSNGLTTLYIVTSQNNFMVTSAVGNSFCTGNFMRINNYNSTYGSLPAYVISNGTVRDIIHQEAEWSNGVPNCSDIYSDIVLTLPANATYFTYQLRLMFVQSQQNRTINDLCPIWLNFTSLTGQLQTENGTANGLPIVSNTSATDLFYNYSVSSWTHHWSQSISGTKGAGIMLTDSANQNLYIFDSITGIQTGALNVSSTLKTIQVLPITLSQLKFNTTLDPRVQDTIWYGAVVAFDTTTPIYDNSDQTGLWMIAEYPPTVAVTAENYQSP